MPNCQLLERSADPRRWEGAEQFLGDLLKVSPGDHASASPGRIKGRFDFYMEHKVGCQKHPADILGVEGDRLLHL